MDSPVESSTICLALDALDVFVPLGPLKTTLSPKQHSMSRMRNSIHCEGCWNVRTVFSVMLCNMYM